MWPREMVIGGACWLLAAVVVQADPAPNRVFHHILPDQLEVIGYINDIAQDARGFMWFAGANGLARYDGYTLTIYRNEPGDPLSLFDNHVRDLLVTPEGALWVATRTGLQLYDEKKDGFSHFPYRGKSQDAHPIHPINQLWQDRQQRLWLATRSGLFEFIPDAGTFRRMPIPGRTAVSDQSLWSIAGDSLGYLWIGHESGGLTRFHPELNAFELFRHRPGDPHSLSSDRVRSIYVDSRDRVWVGTYGGGLNRFDRSRSRFVRYEYDKGEKGGIVWDVYEDKRGAIWVGDGESAGLLEVETGRLTRFYHRDGRPETPGNYAVTSLFRDRAGDIWLGYFPSGVDRVDLRASVFRNYRHDPGNANSLADGNVNTLYEDSKGNLWVGSGLGLTYFDRQRHKFTRVRHRPGDTNSPSGSTVISVLEDYEGVLWAGIWTGGLNRRDPVTGAYIYYQTQPGNPRSLLGQEPWSLLEDSRRDLWVATELGLNRYDRASDDFTRFVPLPEQIGGDDSLSSRVVYEDSQNRLWWGTERGLFLLDRDTGRFTRYHRENGLGADSVNTLYEDRFGRLWVGTEGGGVSVMSRDGRSFTTYTVKQGLADNIVAAIRGDRNGHIWLATHGGLSRFDPNKQTFRNFDKSRGLPGTLFNRNAAILTRAGELVFGNGKGLVMFDPEELTDNDYVPPVVLTELQILNRRVSPRDKDYPLSSQIVTADHIRLQRHQSMFAIGYAALNFRSSEDNQYAHRLLGFDNEWQQVGTSRLATYTNLDPGEYHFEVRGSNNDGVWNQQPRRIRVTVVAPLWATWWAYTFYCALAALVAVVAYYLFRARLQAVRALAEHERARAAALEERASIQDDALALTCHELRTPLQGMGGLAQALIDGSAGPLADSARQDLGLIAGSAQRLGHLIDNLLDLARLQEHSLTLQRQNFHLHPRVNTVLGLMRPLLGDKPVSLHNRVPEGLYINADADRLQQILFNLLSNAVRFTEQGEIGVTAVGFDRDLEIAVADTGVGMDTAQLETLFQEKLPGHRSRGGSGLGLPLAGRLAELHGGRIEVQSQPGHGSVFRVLLPGAVADPQVAPLSDPVEASSLNADLTPDPVLQGRGAHILVVDDDPISLRALHHILALQDYRVTPAANGAQALAEVEKGDLDLVILDLSMARLSGLDTCRQLRQGHSAQELPVIMLTASSRQEDQLAGFEAGANDYLVKPAAKEQLLARVAIQLRQLEQHRQLDRVVAERNRMHTEPLRLQQSESHSIDAHFTDPLTGLKNRQFLLEHIGRDTEFVVDQYQVWWQLLSAGGTVEPPPNHQDLVFLLLDLDGFGRVNEVHGRAVGDKVLQQLAALLQKVLRETDYLVRWEEARFLIVARAAGWREAADLAERLRRAVAEHPFEGAAELRLLQTCSLGFAEYPFYPAQPLAVTWEQVVERADQALAAAKASGRNTWVGVRGAATAGVADEGGKPPEALIRAGNWQCVSAKTRVVWP